MKNNITELCALLWAMHIPESRNNQGLGSEITELYNLVRDKTQTDAIQTKINAILNTYAFLATPYNTCKQALAQQKDNDWLQTLIVVGIDDKRKRNLTLARRTPLETEKAKGYEIDNFVVEIADHLKNCYSQDDKAKDNAQKAIELIGAHLKL